MNCLGGLNATIGNNLLHNHSIYCGILWQDLHGVENKSIASSIKKFSSMSRSEMESLSKNVDLRYFLGVMNSRYASVLLTNLRGGDYHIYPEHIRNIPIPTATKEQQQSIIDLVDKILAAKKKNPKTDTSDLESQIDEIVYGLYDLTGPEIDIIEKSFAQAKENTENNTSAKTKSTPKKKYLEDTDEEL
jgi:adenine-specific DNA-methyltransferase